MRSLLRRLLGLLLVVALLPGLKELAEAAEHIVHDGHLPHSTDHVAAAGAEGHRVGLDDEHGCTPMSHHCGCCVSAPGLPCSGIVQLQPPARPQPELTRAEEAWQPSQANAPPTRPPIS